ncbi:hypothetical protein COU37_03815 [Candidatus Micrarchaeota archaeon CG10_big_fil_rev_8_21_14_0_10_45_29]|nr:MAG: hypothetical protein COU37_03815 [Candidatus Micrarchaeota archaeon CG10_big_fil_rev_8_21_14_0_10_45_29]
MASLKNKIIKGTAIAATTLFLGLMPLANGCGRSEKPLEISTIQKVQLPDERPNINLIKIDKNKIIAKTNSGDFVFSANASLKDAKIYKVDKDLWCILNISSSDEIILISPIKHSLGGWELSADATIMKPFREGETLLQSTFQVLSNNAAIIFSDSNKAYHLSCKLVTPTSKNPREPFVSPYAQKERNIFFSSFNFTTVQRKESIPLCDEVTSKIIHDPQYGEIVAISHPGWKYDYGVNIEPSENPMGERINTFVLSKEQ